MSNEKNLESKILYEMILSNQSLSTLITALRQEGAIPEAIATQLLEAVKASSDRLYELRPRTER